MCTSKSTWAVLSDEQMSNGLPFSLLNDEQMSNKMRVEQQSVLVSSFADFFKEEPMGFSGTPKDMKDMGPPYGKRDPYYSRIFRDSYYGNSMGPACHFRASHVLGDALKIRLTRGELYPKLSVCSFLNHSFLGCA